MKLFATGAPTPRRASFAKTSATLAKMRARTASASGRSASQGPQRAASCYSSRYGDLCAEDEACMEGLSEAARARFLGAAGGEPPSE